MRTNSWARVVAVSATWTMLLSPVAACAAGAQERSDDSRNRRSAVEQQSYDRGFQAGVLQGDADARRGREYQRQFPDRRQGIEGLVGRGRPAYQRGFADGYRTGFGRVGPARDTRSLWNRRGQTPRAFVEQAYGRGMDDGYEAGLRDGRRGDRYDPVGNRNYRAGDGGYARSYPGTRDAYKDNYRAGFREGYEDGYRDARRFDRR